MLTSTCTDQIYYFYFNINEHYHNVTHSHLSLWDWGLKEVYSMILAPG